MSIMQLKHSREDGLKIVSPPVKMGGLTKYEYRFKYFDRDRWRVCKRIILAASREEALRQAAALKREKRGARKLAEVVHESGLAARQQKRTPFEEVTFEELFPMYETYLERTPPSSSRHDTRRRSTRQKHAFNLARIRDEIAPMRLCDLERTALELWIYEDWSTLRTKDGRPYANSTLASMFASLKAFMNYCYGLYNEACPMANMRTIRWERGRSMALSYEELKRFLREAEESELDHYAMIYLGFCTGARFGSLSALRWEDIDEERQMITFGHSQYEGVRAKGSKTHEVIQFPMDDALERILDEHKNRMLESGHPGLESGLVFPAAIDPARSSYAGHLSRSSFNKVLARISKRLGYEEAISSKTFRQTLNTRLLCDGVEPLKIQALLGHKSDAMTVLYARPALNDKRMILEGFRRNMQ